MRKSAEMRPIMPLFMMADVDEIGKPGRFSGTKTPSLEEIIKRRFG